MQHRVLTPEQMDDPELDWDEHHKALVGLRRINAWTANASLVWKQVSRMARELSPRPLRLLDIATGAADIPIALVKRSAACGLKLEIDACDVSKQAISFAAENCAAACVTVRLFEHDIVRDDLPEPYDVVMCSQFLHHLATTEAESVLCKMKAASTMSVVVVDLERTRANWLQVWLATRALSRSKVVHFDGPQSVRAAFTVPEFESLARRAGFTRFEIRRKWPCRFVFVGACDGTA